MSNQDKPVITLEVGVRKRIAGTTSVCFSGDFELLWRGGGSLPSSPENSALSRLHMNVLGAKCLAEIYVQTGCRCFVF